MNAHTARRPLPESLLASSSLWDELEGGVLVIACSGGADSVGLLRAAHALLEDPVFSSRFSQAPALACFHFNHCTRPECETEERFVAELAAALGAAYHSASIQVRDVDDREVAGNSEARFRCERYQALLALVSGLQQALPEGRSVVGLTAHHLGDQAESILLNLVRGSHLAGIRGIHARRDDCICRPWLALPPEEIRSYLQALGQNWCEDISNADTRLSRNRLRHKVLPELLAINPQAREHIARLAGTAQLAAENVSAALQKLEVEVFTNHDLQRWLPLLGWQNADYYLHRSEGGEFASGDLLARYVFEQLRKLAGPRSHADWRQLCEWALHPGRQIVLQDWRARVLHGRLLALQGPPEPLDALPQVGLDRGSSMRLGGLELSLGPCSSEAWKSERSRSRHPWERIRDWGLSMDALSASPPLGPAWHCCLPAEVKLPLLVRAPQAGDRIALPGGGSKLLSDVFIDAKVPRCFRAVWCVIADAQNQPLWLPGIVDSAAMSFGEEQQPALLLSVRDISAHDRQASSL